MSSSLVGEPTTLPPKATSVRCIAGFGSTPTNCCLGLFTLRVGARLVAVCTIIEGISNIFVYLEDRITGEPVFRWGPSSYELWLQFINAVVGMCSCWFGLMGLRSTAPPLRSVDIRLFRRYQSALLMWTVVWFLVVGMPTFVSYVNVPVVQQAPFSKLPGLPRRLMIDPEWPDGMPHVCRDVADMKLRLANKLKQKQKNPLLRKILKRVYKIIFKKVLPCKQVLKGFWLWGALCVAIRSYCVYTFGFLHKAVLHGGNGEFVYGALADLDKPMTDRQSTKAFVKQQVAKAFEQIDTDGDGRLTFEELMGYLEDSSDNASLSPK